MLKEENELLTRVGPGTPMGELMRQYWIPTLMSSELPASDGSPMRVRLLGEDLIAFRDSEGRVGLLSNHCPHRGASLFFGRNEESGLRCVYHGWKFDVSGQCMDMPSEPAESNFKAKIKAIAYPCQERGGIVWSYLGPRSTPPPLPNLEANLLPDGVWDVWTALRECNWAQGIEGEIDTSHFGFLHGITDPEYAPPAGSFEDYMNKDRAPRYSLLDTEYGAMYGAYRPAEEDTYYWRIAQFLLPFFTMIPTGVIGQQIVVRAWVPLDDEHTMFWNLSTRDARQASNTVVGRPAELIAGRGEVLHNTSDWLGRWRLAGNKSNDYLLDRDKQRTVSFSGIPGVHQQDQAITESMGPIYDRSGEHLGTGDAMVIKVRQCLLDTAKALRDHGTAHPTVDHPELYEQRSGGAILPRDVDWVEATREARTAAITASRS